MLEVGARYGGGLVLLVWLIVGGASGSLAFFPLAGLLLPDRLGWRHGLHLQMGRANKPGGFYFSDLWYEFFMGLVPPTVLIAFALGSILAGWATPAEASACGAFGAILLSLAYRKLTVAKVLRCADQDAGNHGPDHVPGCGIELLWCRILKPWNTEIPDRTACFRSTCRSLQC